MIVPENVGLDGVETGALELFQAVPPEFPRAARIMKRAAENELVLLMKGKAVRVVSNDVRVLKKFLRPGRSPSAKAPGRPADAVKGEAIADFKKLLRVRSKSIVLLALRANAARGKDL
ncbi:MAG: hypothetical protein DMG22_21290 [Acidobacteria bacterium]|nr:MAG: hypothetical protein DMG22_21290 [Acidobacteriota bacterium]